MVRQWRVGLDCATIVFMADAQLLAEAADLFNRRLYFECHDLLEEAWARARGEERLFLQGLIHLAVGMYHLAGANYKGAVNQLEKGLGRLGPFLPERDGLDLERLSRASSECLSKARRALEGARVDWRDEHVPYMRERA